MRERLIIAIDGPAGAGKSTCARALAARLGYRFLDTGALYRAVTLKAMRTGVDPADAERMAALALTARIEIAGAGSAARVRLDGEDVSDEIRGPGVTNAVPTVAALGPVRAAILPLQRGFASAGGIVAEGRDIGTVVFPDADVKFFLDADERIRAERRALERGEGDVATVVKEIHARDLKDTGRAVAPLRPAADAIRIDTAGLTAEEVVEEMARHVAQRIAAG